MSETDSPADEQDTTDAQSDENMKTVLYAFTRKAMREDDLVDIRDALEDAGYSMTAGEESGNILIQRPEDTGSDVDIDGVLNS